MPSYAAMRKGRNTMSTVLHFLFNIALALLSTTLILISGNFVFSLILVLISKWRVFAVRPRYWWANIKSNLLDFTVGSSLVFLTFLAGTSGLNLWHLVFTLFYIFWLVFIKPFSGARAAVFQAGIALALGTTVISLLGTNFDPLFSVLAAFIVAYAAARHALSQSEDQDFIFFIFLFALLVSELSWIFYHWMITYTILLGKVHFAVPQFPIAATILFFFFAKGYGSALLHDGKIRQDDIFLPGVFSLAVILVMLFIFSAAKFNI